MRMTAKEAQLEERAKAAVSALLVRHLILPKVFFEARWPSRSRTVDLLAIDRAGFGDVHAVEIKAGMRAAKEALPELMRVPANYLWIAIVTETSERLYTISPELLQAENGLGRVGIIRVQHTPDDHLETRIEAPAERFAGSYYDMADKFKTTSKPDIEFR